MKQYIVTGSTGCLGMALCKILLEQGFTVMALGRNKKLGQKLSSMGAQFIRIDLSEKDKLKQICSNADVIFHCAALSSVWGKYKDFYQSNVVGTANIINATPAKARLVHVSSPSIYFNFKSQYNIKETSPLPKYAANYYIKTKLMAEDLILQAHKKQSLNVVTIRPRGIFGPYDRAIMPRLMSLCKNGYMTIIGDGKQLIDVTYVDNVADALIKAATISKKYSGKIYNITNDEPMPFINILKQVFDAYKLNIIFKKLPYCLIKPVAHLLNLVYKLPLINKEPLLTPYSAGVMALGQTLDINLAKQELNYKAKISIEDGIKRYAKWQLAHD